MSRLGPATTAVGLALAAALVVLPAGVAHSKDSGGSRTRVSASCGQARTTLALKQRNGGIEAEYELDQNRNGRTWSLTMTRNGVVVARGARATVAPSGSFTWRVATGDSAGTDTVVVTARRGSTTCVLRGRI